MNGDIDQEGSVWLLWVLAPCVLIIFLIAGLDGPQNSEIPYTGFMLLGLLSFFSLPLGALAPAFPVSRAGWFWSRVARQGLVVAGASLVWALGLGIGYGLTQRVSPAWEGVLWSLALFAAAALGPFVVAITTGPRARPNQPIPVVPTVAYLGLTFAPWGLGGGMVALLPLPMKAGVAALLLVGVWLCWAGGLLTFQKRDWDPGSS